MTVGGCVKRLLMLAVNVRGRPWGAGSLGILEQGVRPRLAAPPVFAIIR